MQTTESRGRRSAAFRVWTRWLKRRLEGRGEVLDELGTIVRMTYGPKDETVALRLLAELEHIKTHPDLGCHILEGIKQLDMVMPVVRHHHEAWNGAGYPAGLKGEETPRLARIVAVADSIDAMSSDRPYRKGIPDEKLDAILRDGAGKQWDAEVIDAAFQVRDELRRIGKDERHPLSLDVTHWQADAAAAQPAAV